MPPKRARAHLKSAGSDLATKSKTTKEWQTHHNNLASLKDFANRKGKQRSVEQNVNILCAVKAQLGTELEWRDSGEI
jgi:hypothetical protein